jgi:UDP-N-acetylmuramoylalanine--D-glutamate ligase
MKQKIVILGAGESGIGTAILAMQNGYAVFVSDKGKINDKYKKVLLNNNIAFEEGKHSENKILQANIVVKSPGIPDKIALIQKIKDKQIPVISEIEFAGKFTNAKIVGITGSNGKTTTTLLLSAILKNANKNFGTAGNIGDSFALQVANSDKDLYVLELSSFQLDGIVDFKPHIAIITNISPDHLDRYDYNYNNYIASKFRITKNQTKEDFLIYDADDAEINKWLQKNKVEATLIPFALSGRDSVFKNDKITKGAYLNNDKIIIEIDKNTFTMSIADLALQGKHNVKNTMASSMAARLLKVRKETIRQSLSDFEGVEHRLEPVLKINGVQYINDSKATNINSTYYALDSVKTPTVWIVGGVDKGNDYDQLLPLVNEKVKAIVCLGEDNQKIIETFQNVIPLIVETKGASEAVKVAYKMAEKGDTVLLSPACASFDLFKNYEDRGRQFKEAVREL